MTRESNNRPPRPSMGNSKRCNMFKSYYNNSQSGSVAAAAAAVSSSSVYGDDDTYSDLNTDFAACSSGVSDNDDDVFFPKLWGFQDHCSKESFASDPLKLIEDMLLADDEYFGYQSSDTNCFSFATSRGGETASVSCNRSIFLENQMIEEDAVDSLPQPLHQDENGELNNYIVEGKSSEISNSYKETHVNNDGAFWPDACVDSLNNSHLIETDYNAETSQPDETLEIYNRKRKYEMSQLTCLPQPKMILDHLSESDSDTITRNENISDLPDEPYVEEIKAPVSSLFLGDADRPSSSAGGLKTPLELHSSHVRFKIKSFTVPEFFVEVPETASVGYLKKAIMEKATAMVEDGGHLGVVLQGEDMGDESEILPKAGISLQNKLDVISEPQYIQDLNGSSPHHSCVLVPPQPQTWCTPLSSAHQGTTDTSPVSLKSSFGTIFQENHEKLEYRTGMPIANGTKSMSIIACPAVDGSLDMVSEKQKIKGYKCKKRLVMGGNEFDESHVHQNSKSSMNIKRRKTEFFSISEVEALVQAAEELGPGRWQKIKEQAFRNDSRRTYMDVKDKWRSLVKTAKRPVDERRGVFLPQGLLDRVLAIETCKSKYSDIQQ